MELSAWLDELRAATSDADVVDYVRLQLDRLAVGGRLPSALQGFEVDEPKDVRELAARLARSAPGAYARGDGDGDATQRALILLSLATDRLSQMRVHGLNRREHTGFMRSF